MGQLIVRTSEQGWLRELAKAYQERTPTLVIDDASVGIDPASQTLFEMGRHAKLSKGEIIGAAVALGISAVGIVLIAFAFIDPEPYSKLGAGYWRRCLRPDRRALKNSYSDKAQTPKRRDWEKRYRNFVGATTLVKVESCGTLSSILHRHSFRHMSRVGTTCTLSSRQFSLQMAVLRAT